MIRELDLVRLTEDFEGVRSGTTGTVVAIHNGGEAYEVEFMEREGDTLAIPGHVLELTATGDWL